MSRVMGRQFGGEGSHGEPHCRGGKVPGGLRKKKKKKNEVTV